MFAVMYPTPCPTVARDEDSYGKGADRHEPVDHAVGILEDDPAREMSDRDDVPMGELPVGNRVPRLVVGDERPMRTRANVITSVTTARV